jgi:hypothetical protein
MTTPHVTELPRRLEPICSDTFLGSGEDESSAPPRLVIAREPRPLGVVLPMRPRDPGSRPVAKARRRRRRPPQLGSGPGDSAA